MSTFETKIQVNRDRIRKKVSRIIDDNITKLEIHEEFYKMMYDYIPMGDSGELANNVEITKDGVHFKVNYAHYQYMGIVYGPNIPIIKNGVIVGWYSKPKQTKTPTGRRLQYSTEYHPLASSEWDKAMMRDRGEEFVKRVENILIRRAKEYGR